jgi:hypothetical protein
MSFYFNLVYTRYFFALKNIQVEDILRRKPIKTRQSHGVLEFSVPWKQFSMPGK